MKKFYLYGLFLGESVFPFYIGKGHGGRLRAHLEPRLRKTKSLKNHIINKAFAEGVVIVPRKIYDGLDEETAFMMERSYIAHYGRRDIGTGILANHSDGGEGPSGLKQTPELIERRISKIRGVPRSEEAKAKMRKPRMIPRTAEHVAKIKHAITGRKAPPEEIANQLVATFNRRPEIWGKAARFYADWNGETAYRFAKTRNMPESHVSGMLGKFRKGWIPDQDPTWTNWASSR